MMKLPVFIFCLVLSSVISFLYAELNTKYSLDADVHYENKKLKNKLAQSVTDYDFLKFQVSQFEKEVLLSLPNYKSRWKEDEFFNRSIASVLKRNNQSEYSNNPFKSSKFIFLNALEVYGQDDLEEASKLFLTIIENYPYSIELTKSYYFYLDCLHRQGYKVLSIKTLSDMIDKFPEHDLTGYSMLTMAKLYEEEERYQEATLIYKAVIHSFSEHKLTELAKEALERISL